MRALILAYGLPADVEPYVALGAALAAAGHVCTVCTHALLRPLVEEHGLTFMEFDGEDPRDLHEHCLREGLFTFSFVQSIGSVAERWMDGWAKVVKAAVGQFDMVVSTTAVGNAGIHLAEASGVPVCLAHHLPAGETMHFFHPYAPAPLRRSTARPSFVNLFSHHMVEYLYGILALPKANALRLTLGLPPIRGFHWLAGFRAKNDAPRLYGHSPAVLPAPPEWPRTWQVAGYWWLPEVPYTPPKALAAFLAAGPAPVYIHLATEKGATPDTLLQAAVEGCRLAGQRAVVYAPHGAVSVSSTLDVIRIEEIVPHYWLVPRCKVVVHHAGAMLAAYTVKAGVPGVHIPLLGDQHLWASRLYDLGCSPPPLDPRAATAAALHHAIYTATQSPTMQVALKALAERVAAEDGLQAAVRSLEALHRAPRLPREDTSLWQTADLWTRLRQWCTKLLMDRLDYRLRAGLCLAASFLKRVPYRLAGAQAAPLSFTGAPTTALLGLPADGTRDGRNTALRATPTPYRTGQSYFRFDGGAREELVLPATLSGVGYVIVDFGAMRRGRVQLSVECSSPAVVCIGLCERLKGWTVGGDRLTSTVTSGALQAPAIIRLDGGSRTTVSSGAGTFRYVVVSAKAGAFALHAADVTSTLTPAVPHGHPYPGNFRCSCPQLTRVWYAGANTLELCTGGTPSVFLDGSKRDRWVWTGDLFVEHLVAYVSNGDVASALNSLAILAEAQDPDGYVTHLSPPKDDPLRNLSMIFAKELYFTEYCAWYVVVTWLHYLHTGDDTFAREFEPVIDRAMGWLCGLVADDGLLKVGPETASTWHVPEVVLGAPTDLNCLMAHAFRCANALRAAVGKPPSTRWDELRSRMVEAVNARLWDESLGVYLNSDNEDSIPTQDSTTTAVWTEVAPLDRATRALDYLEREHGVRFGVLTAKEHHPTMTSYLSPFASFRHLLAFGRMGDAAGALRLIRRLWVHMAETDPEDVFWEKVSRDGEIEPYWQLGMCPTFTSTCHGWSAGPTYALTTLLLGVTPVTPGYADVAVRPALADLRWAEGVVPTPHGGIAVAWETFGPTECLLRVAVPAGVRATVRFPVAGVPVRRLGGAEDDEPAVVADAEAIPLVGPATAAWATLSCPSDFSFE
eukprot:EG_transcript_1018